MRGKGLSRIAVIQQVNVWLNKKKALSSTGILFEKEGLLGRNGIHLTKEGDCTLANSFGQLGLLLCIKECLLCTELCLGINNEPVRELVCRHQRTGQQSCQG